MRTLENTIIKNTPLQWSINYVHFWYLLIELPFLLYYKPCICVDLKNQSTVNS